MQSSQKETIIDIEHVGRVFAETETPTVALDDISLKISRGEFVSIMGKSGSGKSTLLHVLGLLDRPSRGVYRFRGTDVAHFSDEKLARIRNENLGFVFQAFHLLARSTVLENVMLPLVYSQVPTREHRERALTALSQVEMSHRTQHRPPQLSGGEKQRVAIARALVNSPDVIFADEPTGNLDSRTGETVMRIIDALHEAEHTVVLVTHEQSTAAFAERIIEMQDGRIINDRPSDGRHDTYQK